MGTLKSLKDPKKSIHIVQSDSGLVKMFCADALKEAHGANRTSSYEIFNKQQINQLGLYAGVAPMMADKWFFHIKTRVLDPKTVNLIKGTVDNAVYMLEVPHYGVFKQLKEALSPCNDLYLSRIGWADTLYMLSEFDLSHQLKTYIANTYALKPEAVFELVGYLREGAEIERRSDITALVGVGVGSTATFVLQLLKEPLMTERSFKTRMRLRLSTVQEMLEDLGPLRLKNSLIRTVKDILDVKALLISGSVYDTVRDLPNGYDETRLARYTRHLDKIKEVPYGRVMQMFVLLNDGKMWFSESDVQAFLYSFLTAELREKQGVA